MKKEIEIIVQDGEDTYSCIVKRPDVATLSRTNKLSKVDEVLAAQELLKGCWVSGDEILKEDGYLLMTTVAQMGGMREAITAALKNE
jgi:hypothetical protein